MFKALKIKENFFSPQSSEVQNDIFGARLPLTELFCAQASLKSSV